MSQETWCLFFKQSINFVLFFNLFSCFYFQKHKKITKVDRIGNFKERKQF